MFKVLIFFVILPPQKRYYWINKKIMKKTVLKALLLSFIMAMCSIMPLQAQIDGFFLGGNDSNYENRAAQTGTITNYGIGQTEAAPLGSGLLIMVAAGAGYAVVRRKRFRNGITMLLALVLLLGMTQCKKKIETVSSSNGLFITLDVSDGLKVGVTPGFVDPNTGQEYAKVEFENGDIIYVGHNKQYVGQLTYSDGVFSGTIDDSKLTTADYFHFYFMGSKTPREQTASSITVDIINQTEKYPVISYARSSQFYHSDGEQIYTARLRNYCAIMKFTTPDIGANKAVKLKGVSNLVAVSFDQNFGDDAPVNPYTYGTVTDSEGAIIMHTVSGTERWAILLPNSPVTATATAAGYGATAAQPTLNTVTIPEIVENGYYRYHDNNVDGYAINLAANGIIDGKISIWPGQDTQGHPTGDSKYAYFASGNLQYQASEKEWRFAENQWDIVGDDNANISSTYTGWIDLFGWATSGWGPSLSNYYHPYDVANDDYYYGPHAANTDIGVYTTPYWNTIYQQTESIMHIGTTNCDWGKYLSSNNMITNGGGKLYRTLSFYDGMYFSLYRRNNIRGELKTLIGFGRVHGVFGYIVLPDNWDGTIDPDFKYYNIDMTASPPVIPESIEVNEFTDAEWVVMEAYGVGFAPAGGRRILDSESDTDPDKQTVTKLDNVGDICYYWTSTAPADYSGDLPYRAHVGKFGDSKNPLVMGSDCRSYGCSVRLIYVPSEQN